MPPSIVTTFSPGPIPRMINPPISPPAPEVRRDSGEADRDLAGVHIRQIAERIRRGDVLEVFGVALRGDGGGIALAFADDLELFQCIDRRREIEVVVRPLARGEAHLAPDGVETRVGQ